jgi:hypothetical protein
MVKRKTTSAKAARIKRYWKKQQETHHKDLDALVKAAEKYRASWTTFHPISVKTIGFYVALGTVLAFSPIIKAEVNKKRTSYK